MKISLAKRPKIKLPRPAMPMPEDFDLIRRRMVHYYENLSDYIDKDSMVIDEHRAFFNIKPIEKVLNVKKLGEGYYSKVYQVGDKALKIVKNEDRAYASFIRFLEEEGHKYSCFPKVFYYGIWAGKAVYIIELMEVSEEDEENSERQFLSEIACNFFRGRREVKPNRFFNVPNDFYEGLKALKKYYQEYSDRDGFGEDLHAGNIMVRPDGTPVITDPFS